MVDSAGQRFDRIARNFATSEVHRESATMRRLREYLEPRGLRSLCDVACGAGHLGLSFSDSIQRLVFCDPAPNMLSEVRKLAAARSVRIETRECVAEQLPFEDHQFDLVCSRLAPHHFGDVQRAICEMARVVSPGGYVAIIDWLDRLTRTRTRPITTLRCCMTLPIDAATPNEFGNVSFKRLV